ncbi:MAG: FGGY-family carbohydrate kinase [Oscillospiraceae bacterium]|nr:FGGY-family carbohydrate kinase [Oscillospiraceae bacterium]
MDYEAGRAIQEGHTYLGIKLGSSKISATLIDLDYNVIASGAQSWESRLEDGVWIYDLDDMWADLEVCFARLCTDVLSRYGLPLTTTGCIGVSATMNGYLPCNRDGHRLTPFRTWRNTNTEEAAGRLSEAFGLNIPQRWSVTHLYQAILNGETHIYELARLNTLAGYVHERLTGHSVLGICDASGMFPVDGQTYDAKMLETFDALVAPHNMDWKLSDLLPRVLTAGEAAGSLTPEGARLLDLKGNLQPGIPFCPPEGDLGTGMVAANSVAERMGNLSAGTSLYASVVLERPLSVSRPEIDIVATPDGKPAAVIHCNNCTADLDAWISLFHEVIEITGATVSPAALYNAFYQKALEDGADDGGLLSYNYVSGEPMTGVNRGRPLLARLPDSRLTLPAFARTILYSTVATLRLGMDALAAGQVRVDRMTGHGGLFKTGETGQRLSATALNLPVTILSTAPGDAWGAALLAAYHSQKIAGETLEDFLSQRVFANISSKCLSPDPKDVRSFSAYMERFKNGLPLARSAAEHIR